jgi:hypothetical protein
VTLENGFRSSEVATCVPSRLAVGGQHMTRTQLQINLEDMWRTLVFEQRTTLTLAVEMLLRCHLSPEQILIKTAMALEGSSHDS